MKNSKKHYICLWFSAITALLAISCVNEIQKEEEENKEIPSIEDKIPIKISTQILCVQTRVSDNKFENNDKIGLYVLEKEQNINQTRHVDNMCFTCTSSGITPDKDIYYPTGKDACTFISYYPYQEEGILPEKSNMEISIKANQSSASAYNISDFMVATATDVIPTTESVNLKHHHKLCQLNITLALSEEDNIAHFQEKASVVIKNIYTQASYDFINGQFTALDMPQDIIPNGAWAVDNTDKKLKGKKILLFPQQITNCRIFLYIDDLEFSAPLPSDLILTSNTSSEINLKCNLKVGISDITFNIDNWQEGSKSDVTLEEEEKNHSISIASLDFEQTNIYNIVNASNEVIAEVCKEYLLNESIDAQAIVLYPTKNKTQGTVLQILNKNEHTHGGSIIWDTANHSFTYTPGNKTPITSLYTDSEGNISFQQEGNTQPISSTSCVLTDIRGSETITYPIVKIGTQYWMRENLKTTQYNSGGKIPAITALAQSTAGYYNKDGNLFYNKAVVTKEALAPQGWKIPSDKEWNIIKTYTKNIAATLKAGSNWTASTGIIAANNLTGFNAHPIGFFTKATTKESSMHAFGTKHTGYWSMEDTSTTLSEHGVQLRFDNNEIRGMTHNEYSGYSIRCIKE